MSRFRRVPPVDSPLPAGVVVAACTSGADVRSRLASLVEAEYGAEEVVLCDSGTSALRLALQGCLASTGEAPISLPAFACYDVGSAVVGAGGRVLFHDIDPRTLGPDLASMEATLKRGARTVVIVHPFGIPIDWEGVNALARRYDALVIEDAAQAHGGVLDGRPLGSLGALSILSFGRGKGWTGAGGGALLARGEGLRILGRAASRMSERASPSEVGTLVSAVGHTVFRHPSRYWLPAALPWLHLGETVFHAPSEPRPMTRLSARIALGTHAAAADSVPARRVHAGVYRELLKGLPGVQPIPIPEGASPGLVRFPVRVWGGLSGFPDVEGARRLGIESTYPTALSELQPLSRLRIDANPALPGGAALARELVTLPTHEQLRESDIVGIVEVLTRASRSSEQGGH